MSATEDLVARLRDGRLLSMGTEELLRRCESPLEELFVLRLERADMLCNGCLVGLPRATHIEQQVEHETGRRVDFLISWDEPGGTTGRAVVELDGFTFHERTREQAERDRARDREWAARGIHAIRYLSHEVMRRNWIEVFREQLERMQLGGESPGFAPAAPRPHEQRSPIDARSPQKEVVRVADEHPELLGDAEVRALLERSIDAEMRELLDRPWKATDATGELRDNMVQNLNKVMRLELRERAAETQRAIEAAAGNGDAEEALLREAQRIARARRGVR